jgi:hypothetical protein
MEIVRAFGARMTEHEQRVIAARAKADRQIAHVDATIEEVLVPLATQLLGSHDTTDAWALLATEVTRQIADRPEFMAQMVALMVVRRVGR